jgi:xylan 1,4-beta-xylosidase
MPLFGNFWHGSPEDYLQLYDQAADAIKSVDSRLRAGGPAAATPAFMSRFLDHVAGAANAAGRTHRVPLDFLSYHAYSSPLIDWRPLLKRLGFADLPVFYTEWGVSARAGEVVNDLPFGAAWLASVLMESNDSASLFAYWTGAEYSDEQKTPKSLFHGGFGLLGFDSIRKPRYWAYFMLHQMGTTAWCSKAPATVLAHSSRAWQQLLLTGPCAYFSPMSRISRTRRTVMLYWKEMSA